MARSKFKRKSKLRKFLDFITCFSCFISRVHDKNSEYDNNIENIGNIVVDRDEEVGRDNGNDINSDDDTDSDSDIVYQSNSHDRNDEGDMSSDNDRNSDDISSEDDRIGEKDSDSDRSSEYDRNDGDILQDKLDVIDIDEEEIIVTRVYACASAQNIVRHHDNFFSKSESDTDIKNYVTKKVQNKPNMKSRHDSEWKIPSTDREVRIDRWMDFYSEIDIHQDAENDMWADGDLVHEDEPENHVTGENGDRGNWDLFIA